MCDYVCQRESQSVLEAYRISALSILWLYISEKTRPADDSHGKQSLIFSGNNNNKMPSATNLLSALSYIVYYLKTFISKRSSKIGN